jgi:hypothetical protein
MYGALNYWCVPLSMYAALSYWCMPFKLLVYEACSIKPRQSNSSPEEAWRLRQLEATSDKLLEAPSDKLLEAPSDKLLGGNSQFQSR